MFRRPPLLFCAATAAITRSGIAAPEWYGKNFRVSSRAWERIREKNAEEGFANAARVLRLAIDSGGCHGYLYKFSFEDAGTIVPDEDVVVTQSQVASVDAESDTETASAQSSDSADGSPAVVVDKISVTKLENAVLDYHSELKGAAFVVVGNELVDQSCACALSFSLKKSPKKKGASTERKPAPASSASSSTAEAATTTSTTTTAQATPIQRKKRE